MKGQQTLATSHGFAIDGNNLSLDQAVYRLHPTEKTLLKNHRFNGGDQTSKGVINRDPSFKQAVAEKPIMVAQNVLTNVRPATGSSNNGTHSAKQNIKQRIVDFSTLPMVLDNVEACFDAVDNHAGAPKKRA